MTLYEKPNQVPKISVIVPIYNVERYLQKCLGSLCAQTLYDIEIICIDDGSTDSSPAILADYAARDSRIRAIHKANTGYGATMNCGLQQARGEYIGIVESDDWVDSDMFESLYALAKENDAQVVKSNYYAHTADGEDRLIRLLPENDLGQIISPQACSDIFYAKPTIWSGIYSRAFLQEKSIFFLETPGAAYQDVSFNFKVWASAERVWFTEKAYVHYRTGHSEASVAASDKVFCVRDEWNEIERFMAQNPEAARDAAELITHVKFDNYLWNLRRLRGENKLSFKRFFIKEYRRAKKDGTTHRLHHSLQEKYRYLSHISPNPFGYKLIRLFLSIAGVILKFKVKNNRRTLRAFFGLIRVGKEGVRITRPTFRREELC